MLRSMTGYGNADSVSDKFTFKVEVKSLNGKYLELNLRLPKIFSEKEMELRNHIGNRIARGTVTLFVNLEKNQGNDESVGKINSELVKNYYNQWKAVSDELGCESGEILANIMQMPEVIKHEDEIIEDEDWNACLSAIDAALEKFDAFRNKEGKVLGDILRSNCMQILKLLKEVEQHEIERLESTKTKLLKNLNELSLKDGFDKNRFEQELVYYLEKLDITEEKNRLQTHCNYFLESMNENSGGRKLSFISQEMGREINTMGAKAGHAELQKVVVKMKEELEKIKEQVLNIL
ncbi:MAG: YicC family protein [Flavobacteriales bacterium]|nr:YicC family protein [Flavobacteriales bacterium]